MIRLQCLLKVEEKINESVPFIFATLQKNIPAQDGPLRTLRGRSLLEDRSHRRRGGIASDARTRSRGLRARDASPHAAPQTCFRLSRRLPGAFGDSSAPVTIFICI